MKKIAVLFLGLALSVASFGISTARAAGSATFTLSPTNTSVETGDSFSLSVLVDPNGELINTVRVEIEFDAGMLEVTAFDLGSMFPYQSPSNEIDNGSGTLSQGAFKFGEPIESSGTFATVTFRALSAGDAVISITSDSRLIEDGEEKLNADDLGAATITISGRSSESTTFDADLEAQALVYYGALAGDLPSVGDEWEALKCIAYGGCQGDPQDLDRELLAVELYLQTYNALPSTDMEWNAIHTIAYTDVFIDWANDGDGSSDTSLEKQALVYFGAFYARMPSSGDDWTALHCIAYGGCQGDPRDLQAEGDALVLFGAKYATMPSTGIEWNVLHTIAYTDLLTFDEQDDEGLSDEQIAIGWFGTLTGEAPDSDEDWLAIDYMVNGYTPETQDLGAESAAIATFTDAFRAVPSSGSDWNIIAAIAYSGAF